ncbi:MAG TPA: M4 family metallopeptidase [Stellaceae bacterium]|nr:M4 family metallopeptidase [Stellaceae bacterium]
MCTRRHVHTVCCLLPPHILHALSKNGTAQQKKDAQRTLTIDAKARAKRTAHSKQPLAAPAATKALKRTIYDGGKSETLPGRPVRGEGAAPSKDTAVNQAYEGLGATFKFYLEILGRNSIDGKGMAIDATVHHGDPYSNAQWTGTEMIFGDGDGTTFRGFTTALDVIAHELSHGVTRHEANLAYHGESGALCESFSDVMASLVKQYKFGHDVKKADWLIGKGMLVPFPDQAFRSLKVPGTAYDNKLTHKDPQPAKMSDFVHTTEDDGGVHINSGIPNRAFYLVAEALGGHAWEKAGRIWYDTICDPKLRATATFVEFAARTAFNASKRYGGGSHEQKAVANAWKEVGVTPLQ